MLVDIAVVALLISIIFRGREIGLVRQMSSIIGFVAGLFLGAVLQPHLMVFADTTLSRALLSIVATLGCALLLMRLGERLGDSLKRRLEAWMPLNKADAFLGSVTGAVALLAIVWLFAPVVSSLPWTGLQQAVHSSAIVSQLNRRLPAAPDVISRIDRIVNPNGFPDVFAGLERQPLQPDTPLPSLGELQPAVEQARPSIVKVEGRGCGGVVDGSGFVADQNIVITNAHVVAGVDKPTVVDTNGRHNASVIWFDDELDIAVLRVADNLALAGKPLVLNNVSAATGTPSVVVGYPGGGGFTASPATVLDRFTARGRDIYGRGMTNRDIYELRADVVPGNSGGPLLDKQGKVIGVVFAESVNYEDIGYALNMQPVIAALQQAVQRNQPAATGACAG